MPPRSTSGARYQSVTICQDACGVSRLPVPPAAARVAHLVRVALHGHAESAAEAQVGNLQDIAPLVHQQVLRLQISAWFTVSLPQPLDPKGEEEQQQGRRLADAPVHDTVAVEVRDADAELIHEVLHER